MECNHFSDTSLTNGGRPAVLGGICLGTRKANLNSAMARFAPGSGGE
jgi:hypothetical protein